ncbi:unnamed protein product [Sphagnum jensenii]|uniref:phosphoglucomutase (alpha-D-glucose-1,6-bisphosphate-dependent) n=1 Tax=Sphagnum jensenii TaxID=128206 RepID=A0ABP0VHB8_9BRYO
MPHLMEISPRAGELAGESERVDLNKLLEAYEREHPDVNIPAQKVKFGTSGHRGSSLDLSFNEDHIIAITQAICNYRKTQGITGPLFIGYDTHALSLSAYRTALTVLVGNGITVFKSIEDEYTPTPVISHAILNFNKNRITGLADGIVVTPSHNPPEEGGIKYNSTHGGPAQASATQWIQADANRILLLGVNKLSKMSWEQASCSDSLYDHDFVTPYIADLKNVIDLGKIRDTGLTVAVDPMGGAGVHYWDHIAELYDLNLIVTNREVDPSFKFIPRDWDGKIRMDPTSSFAMKPLIEQRNRFDISFACDTDHDRHGIVSAEGGLMSANQYLTAASFYLFGHRPLWSAELRLGKTVVSTELLDRVARYYGRNIFEVPVGFKWFEYGLFKEELALAVEESGGASILRGSGGVWTTDKDGIVMGLLAAEITATLGHDPWQLYHQVEESLGVAYDTRIDSSATQEQMSRLAIISPQQVQDQSLAGEKISQCETRASGDFTTHWRD